MRKSLFVFMLVFISTATDYAAAQQKRMELTVLNSMQRISQNQKATGPREVVIKAARNEVESFQVVVSAFEENINVVEVEISELVGEAKARIGKENITLYREEYVRVRRSTPRADLPPGLYPDPLVPFINPLTGEPIEPSSRYRERWGEPIKSSGYRMYALPFEVFRGQNQPLWVDVHIPKDTPAGVYKGTIRVVARGRITDEIPVTLTVWGFTLPDGPTHKNHFGSFRNVARFFNIKRSSQRFNEIEMRYCEEMARHRINPPLPQRLLPSMNDDGSLKIIPERHKELRAFMSRLNVTDFEIPKPPFVKLPRSTLQADYKDISPSNRKKAIRYYRDYYNYLKENGWEKRAYVYMLDEPNTKENYEQVLVLGALVHEAVPQLRCLVVEQTYKQNAEWPDIDPAVDIWCPLWSFIDRETINEKIAHGDEVWSYTALVQRSKPYHKEYERFRKYDPPYWHIDRPLTVYRVPTWVNRQYNIAGLLYWSTVTMVLEPWTLPAFTHPRHFNGGGYLFYPGVPCGIDGPIPCMRLKNLRDGMEDYEYFVILEELAGKKAVDKIVDSVAPEWWQFAKDPQIFLSAREKMANEILRLTP
jgi:Glycoside hydrolase 123, catalytic domain/Glycoside hydrolase 123, N-terminal domain